MSPKLTNKLFNKYPKIFADKDKPITQSLIRTIDTEDGWYDLIDNLCGFIQERVDKNSHLGIEQVKAAQVKQKMSGLRFYYDGGDDIIIEGAVQFAESLSYRICEVCGTMKEVGHTTKGWLTTCCGTCYMEKKAPGNNWKLNN